MTEPLTQGQRAIIGDYLLRDLQAAIDDSRAGLVNVSRLKRIMNYAIKMANPPHTNAGKS